MSERTVEEERWLLALEKAIFGVWDLDPRLETVHYSPQWKARLGFPRIHAPDSTAFWRCRVHPDDFGPMLSALRSHLDGDSPSYEAQFRLRSTGSGYRTVLSRGRVVARDHRGDATRMVGTMVDLTRRPVAAAPHGLAAEDSSPTIAVVRTPFHAALGAARLPAPSCAAADAPVRLVERVDDLLEMALRDASASP